MNKVFLAIFFMATGVCAFGASEQDEKAAAKAPYANDLGTATINVSNYPAPFQKTYKELFQKCSKCHTIARPINSQFLEISQPEIEGLKKKTPDVLTDENVFKMEDGIWKRYVKRMMSKPGCDIKSEEGKVIWQFLVYDSRERKFGKNMATWTTYRKKLLKEFKEKHPERYEELYEKKGN